MIFARRISERRRFRAARNSGLTLVELMVTLVILAGLLTAASVSTATFRERHRAEKTASIGRAIVDALNRVDGLSFVSDMGRLPASADELKYLFAQDNGLAALPAYSQHALAFSGLPIADSHVTNNFAMPTLGAGWRGPYCDTAAAALGADGALLDGFGGEWSFDGEILVSFGRDQSPDFDDAAASWQDSDQVFSLRPARLTSEVELTVNVSCVSSNAVRELHAYYFEPAFSGGCVSRHFSVTNSASLSISGGLSVGKRALFVYAKDSGGAAFADAPRLIHLRPGNNAEAFTLFKK